MRFFGLRRAAPAVAAALSLLSPGVAPAAPSTAHVHVIGQSFDPQFVSVLPGDSVEWDNHGTVTHTVTDTTCLDGDPAGCEFDQTLTGGTGFFHAFPAAGVFNYTCRIHGFSARITVAGAPGSLPDYDVRSLSVHDATAFGAPLPTTKRLDAVVSNAGDAPSPDGTLRFQYSYQGTWRALGDVSIPALSPGQQMTLSRLWQTEARIGDFTVRAVADPGGAVAELRESNNERWETAAILLPPGLARGIDLLDPV